MIKLFYLRQFNLACHLFELSLNVSYIRPLGPYQVLPSRARVDLGMMAMKEYTAFPKAPGLLEPRYQIF